jgi:hypothetical protein
MARETRANDLGSFQKVVDERTKDGVFVFRDPKLDADLNLIFKQVKIVRGMEDYGWVR